MSLSAYTWKRKVSEVKILSKSYSLRIKGLGPIRAKKILIRKVEGGPICRFQL